MLVKVYFQFQAFVLTLRMLSFCFLDLSTVFSTFKNILVPRKENILGAEGLYVHNFAVSVYQDIFETVMYIIVSLIF